MTQNKDTVGRDSVRNLSEAIYSPLEKPVDITLQEFDAREVTIYTVFGKHHNGNLEDMVESGDYPQLYDVRYDDDQVDVAEESGDAYAKMTHVGGTTRYFVKAGAGGHFYNPMSMYAGAGSSTNRKIHGRAEWNFVEVHRKCFELYLTFLRSKNKLYLTQAERQVL